MKRAVLLTTIALSTAGLAACGSSPESAGEEIGKSISTLQQAVMTRPVAYQLDGIEAQIKTLKSEVSKESYAQLEAALEELHEHVAEAENHADKLHEASLDGVEAFENVTGDEAITKFKEGLRKGFDEGVN